MSSPANRGKLICQRVLQWFFPSAGNRWVALLRLGLSVQLIAYAASLRHDWVRLLNPEARRISEAILTIESPIIPRIGWFVSLASSIGLKEPSVVTSLWFTLLAAATLLLLGLFCRTSAIIAWLLHLGAVKSASIFSYGVDGFTTIGLFYLAVSPLPDPAAADSWLRKRQPRFAELSGFFRRALQLHLCCIYLFSGLSKMLGVGWWNGDNLWRAMTRPPFDVLDPTFIARGSALLPVAGIVIWVLELGYTLFIWPKQTRVAWLLAVTAMHICIGVFMNMPLFALVMVVLNLAAFGPIPGDDQAA